MEGAWKDWIAEDMVEKHLQKIEAKGCVMSDSNLYFSSYAYQSSPIHGQWGRTSLKSQPFNQPTKGYLHRKDTESLIARLVEEKLQTWVAKQRMEWSQHFLAQHHERRGASCQTMSLSVMSKPDPHS